jgi:hypothetical protein
MGPELGPSIAEAPPPKLLVTFAWVCVGTAAGPLFEASVVVPVLLVTVEIAAPVLVFLVMVLAAKLFVTTDAAPVVAPEPLPEFVVVVLFREPPVISATAAPVPLLVVVVLFKEPPFTITTV